MSGELKYNMIVAFDLYRGIGKDNKLPWYFPEDLKNFSKLTRGKGNNAIIMGRHTWESIPKTPLKNRDNLILSTTLNIEDNSPKNNYVKTFSDISEIDIYCKSQNYDTVWIIGGQKIYEQYLSHPNLQYIYVTFIPEDYKCDSWFPPLTNWNLISGVQGINNPEIKGNTGTKGCQGNQSKNKDIELYYQIYKLKK